MAAYRITLNFSIMLLIAVRCVEGANSTHQDNLPHHKRLFNDLMASYGSTSVRPVKDSNKPIQVRFYFKPFILSEFNEQNQRLSIIGTYYMGWVDDMLKWDPEDYGGVERISLRVDDIWMPDITAYERLDVGNAYVNIFEPYAVVNSSGYVNYYDLSDLTVYCRLHMTLFPFDTQICQIVFSSYSYDSDQLELSYANTTSSNENGFAPNGVWKLDTFLVQEEEVLYTCCPNPYVEVHYAFFMKRIGNFYIYSMWIPSGLLSSMIIAVFIMHPNSGEKVSLSVSNVLAFVLFQQIVVGSMPRSGDDSPIIVALFSAMIALSCLSVLASAVVLRVYHHDPKKPVPKILRFLVIRRKLADVSKPRADTNGAYTNPMDVDETNKRSPIVAIFSQNEADVTTDTKEVTSNMKNAIHSDEPLQTNHNFPVHHVVQEKVTLSRGRSNYREETDWMILALVLDKIFLAIAVFALSGTLMFCGINYLVLLADDPTAGF